MRAASRSFPARGKYGCGGSRGGLGPTHRTSGGWCVLAAAWSGSATCSRAWARRTGSWPRYPRSPGGNSGRRGSSSELRPCDDGEARMSLGARFLSQEPSSSTTDGGSRRVGVRRLRTVEPRPARATFVARRRVSSRHFLSPGWRPARWAAVQPTKQIPPLQRRRGWDVGWTGERCGCARRGSVQRSAEMCCADCGKPRPKSAGSRDAEDATGGRAAWSPSRRPSSGAGVR